MRKLSHPAGPSHHLQDQATGKLRYQFHLANSAATITAGVWCRSPDSSPSATSAGKRVLTKNGRSQLSVLYLDLGGNDSLHLFVGSEVFFITAVRDPERSELARYERCLIVQSYFPCIIRCKTESPRAKIALDTKANSSGNDKASLQLKQLTIVHFGDWSKQFL